MGGRIGADDEVGRVSRGAWAQGGRHAWPTLAASARSEDRRARLPRREGPDDGPPVRGQIEEDGGPGPGLELLDEQVRGLDDPVVEHVAGQLDPLAVGYVPGEPRAARIRGEPPERGGDRGRRLEGRHGHGGTLGREVASSTAWHGALAAISLRRSGCCRAQRRLVRDTGRKAPT